VGSGVLSVRLWAPSGCAGAALGGAVRALWARPLGVPGKALRPRWPAGYQARLRRPGNAVHSKTTHPLNIIVFTGTTPLAGVLCGSAATRPPLALRRFPPPVCEVGVVEWVPCFTMAEVLGRVQPPDVPQSAPRRVVGKPALGAHPRATVLSSPLRALNLPPHARPLARRRPAVYAPRARAGAHPGRCHGFQGGALDTRQADQAQQPLGWPPHGASVDD